MTWTSGFTDINLSGSIAAAGTGAAAAALTATRAVAASDASKEQREGLKKTD